MGTLRLAAVRRQGVRSELAGESSLCDLARSKFCNRLVGLTGIPDVIRQLVESHLDWHICGEAGNGKEAVEKVLVLKPDLVLMDVSMPLMNGFEVLREIRRLSPGTKTIILSMHNSPQMRETAERAGARAYVAKSSSAEDLRDTIPHALEETAV